MNRRDFVKFIALLAAGTTAHPDAILAFERYYNLNSPQSEGLICIDEVLIGGLATESIPTIFDVLYGNEVRLPFAINLYGGVIRWIAGPDQKLVMPADQLRWRCTAPAPTNEELNEQWRSGELRPPIYGHISYIGQDGIRQNILLRSARGRIAQTVA